MSAQRVIVPEPGRAELQPFDPGAPGGGELGLAAEITLISPGTERAFMLNLPNTSGDFPRRVGYNFVGRISAIGAGVEGWQIGQRVVASAPHASAVVVRTERVVAVPDAVDSEQASFFNMLCIAMQGVRKARIELGEPVVVFGQGMVGQLALRLARLNGGLPVVGLDPSDVRRGMAAPAADAMLDPTADGFREALAALVGAHGPPVVIEATGAPQPIQTALEIAAPHGRVVLLGSTRGINEEVNFYRDVHRLGVQIIGAHANAVPRHESHPGYWTWRDNCHTALQLMARGRLSVADMITHRFPSASAAGAYEILGQWDPTLLGMILDWR